MSLRDCGLVILGSILIDVVGVAQRFIAFWKGAAFPHITAAEPQRNSQYGIIKKCQL
jgi:hypothetical protein